MVLHFCILINLFLLFSRGQLPAQVLTPLMMTLKTGKSEVAGLATLLGGIIMIAVIVRIPLGGRGEGVQGADRGGSDQGERHRPLGRGEMAEGVLGLVGDPGREGACPAAITASTGIVTE